MEFAYKLKSNKNNVKTLISIYGVKNMNQNKFQQLYL